MTSSEQIFNTLVLPYLNHAVRTYESGYASVADIDAAMRFGCGYPKGPLTVVDEIGAAQVRDLLAARYAETGDHLHQPADLLEKLVAEGRTFADEAAAAGESAAPLFKHDIHRVGVVGTGTMASGIVQVFAQAGYDVVYVGRSQDKLDGVVGYITKNLDRAIAKGKGTEGDKDALLGRLTGSTEREALGDVDIVVEAIAEDLEIKLELFRDLDKIAKPGAILATTTSSLPITQLGAATGRPQDVIGMHFFNPAPVMKLVEIITTAETSADVDETVRALTANVGKVGVSARRPLGLHRQPAPLPLPQRRHQAGRGRRGADHDRRRDQGDRRVPDGPVRAARRGRQRRVAGDPEGAVRRVRRARLRAGEDARGEGRRRRARSQDQEGLPRLLRMIVPRPPR